MENILKGRRYIEKEEKHFEENIRRKYDTDRKMT